MLTLFTVPKPFAGLASIHQRNALRSWTLLSPAPNVILFGDEPGVGQAAESLGLTHHAHVEKSELGTPLLSSVFGSAHRETAGSQLLGYVNADIILLQDFVRTLEIVSGWRSRFLLLGRRWDVDVPGELRFDARGAEELRSSVRSSGERRDGWWIDYFVFPRGLWSEIPSFAVGRPAWDNWMVFDAIRRGIPVVDGTESITAIHQRHGHSHVPRARGDHWQGPEGDRNRALAGGQGAAYSIDDATHRVCGDRVRRRYSLQPVRRRWERWERALGPAGGIARAIRHLFRCLRPRSVPPPPRESTAPAEEQD